LIHLRKTNKAFKSRHFHFIEDKNNPRVIHYIKTDEDHKQVEIILNCSEDSIVVQRKGNELFSLLQAETILQPKGVFIQQI